MAIPLLIFGDTDFAILAARYFQRNDSGYIVKGFVVDEAFRKLDRLAEWPVYRSENISDSFIPSETAVFIATGYKDLGQLRQKKFDFFRKQGFAGANYISPYSVIDGDIPPNANIMIMDMVNIQFGAAVGEGCIIFSSVQVCHDSRLGAYSYLSPSSVVCGGVTIGSHCFIGAGATLANGVSVGDHALVGMNTPVRDSLEKDQVVFERDGKILTRKGAANYASKI